ncbi:MAG: FAD-dependent oxidoreductase [Cytophagales bacterium]|nr:FAD-dependent oxidoreductase [Cytophagales bacterium]
MNNKLTIVGGGITGLSVAYLAAKAGKKVTVLEASTNFGGLLNTFEIGGNRLEFYYHHFFTHDAELNWLIRELGLSNKLQFHPTTMGVFRDGKIYDFNSPIDLLKFKPISFLGKIRFGLSSLFLGKVAQWKDYENVSCLSWFYKYAGKNTTDALWKPLLDIKFGPYADKVPLAWMVGRLRQRMNSRKKGEEKLGYLDGSLQVLLDRLIDELQKLGVELINNAPVEKLNINNNKLESVTTPRGIFEGGQFLFTIPSIYLKNLLTDIPTLASQLENIKYFGAVAQVVLGCFLT